MEIKLSEKQFKALVYSSFISDWISSEAISGEEELEGLKDQLRDLHQYVLKLCKDKKGFETEKDESAKRLRLSLELVQKAQLPDLMEEYDEINFWEKLSEQLAYRELKNELGEQFTRLDTEVFWQRVMPIIEKYQTEFQENGLDKVKVNLPKDPS